MMVLPAGRWLGHISLCRVCAVGWGGGDGIQYCTSPHLDHGGQDQRTKQIHFSEA